MTAPASQVTFSVEDPVYTALSRKAKAEGIATGRYARMLFEAAYAARCKPQGDKELEAAIERMFKVLPSAADPDLQKKWEAACKTIEGLRKDYSEAIERHRAEIASLGVMVVEGAPAVDPDAEALRAKITELSAQIVAAGDDRAVAEAATKEAAQLLLKVSEHEAELARYAAEVEGLHAECDSHHAENEALEQALAEAKALPPPAPIVSTDELVTAIVMGWGASFDSTDLAARTGLSEATVSRILGAWRDEIQSRKAAA